MFKWKCPKCGEEISFPTLGALSLAERAGGCQGCRAKATIEKNPGLMGLFLGFWEKYGFPQSVSWTQTLEVVS